MEYGRLGTDVSVLSVWCGDCGGKERADDRRAKKPTTELVKTRTKNGAILQEDAAMASLTKLRKGDNSGQTAWAFLYVSLFFFKAGGSWR